jgi:hypothetical protein
MKTQVSELHEQRIRITGAAKVISRAAAIAVLLAWTPSSIGSANHDPVPARLPAEPTQAAGTNAVPVAPAPRSGDLPAGPMCAELSVFTATRVAEANGELADDVGCGIGNNLALGAPVRSNDEERVDVATFLAWHLEGRNLGQDNYQATLSSWAIARDHRASALTVVGPFWTTIAR